MALGSNRNIVLICLDSVRNDFFEATASRTIELADISYDHCRAASSWSVPSQASMVTGQLPHEHGVHTYSRSYDALPKEQTIFSSFDDYRTVGISANVYSGPAFDFDAYFDEFHSLVRQTRFPEAATAEEFLSEYDGDNEYVAYLKAALTHEHPLKSLCNGAIEFTSHVTPFDIWRPFFDEGAAPGLRLARRELDRSEEPTFIFMNLMEGHVPYRPAIYLDSDLYDCPRIWSSNTRDSWDLRLADEYDEQYWNRRNQLYRAYIDYLDRQLADFVADVSEETTVIVTADHGDDLGTAVDERLVNHKSSLTEGVLHVPLHVINAPARVEPQESRYVSHLQLPEMLRNIRNGRFDDVIRDRISAEVIGMGGGSPPPEGVDTAHWDRTIRCSYRGSEKVVWDSRGDGSRYRLADDRSNWQRRTDALSAVPEWAKSAFGTDIESARARAKDESDAVEIDSSTESRLQELGYL